MGNTSNKSQQTIENYQSVSDFEYSESKTLTPELAVSGEVRVKNVTYIIERLLGEGTYGKVYRVQEKENGCKRALKLIKPLKSVSKGYSRSARTEYSVYMATREVCHENEKPQYVPCLINREDFEDGGSILVTDLARGTNCSKAFETRRHNMTREDFVLFLIDCVKPIRFLHHLGVTHGDIKPENIVADFDKDTGRANSVMYVDFGLSCSYNSILGGKGDLCNNKWGSTTPTYMDPDFRKGVSNLFQSDMYSVGNLIAFFTKQQNPMGNGLILYLNSLASELKGPKSGNRPGARQTIAAIRRGNYSRGDSISVSGVRVKVIEYIKKGLGKCELLVRIVSDIYSNELAILKLLYTGFSTRSSQSYECYRFSSERERFALSNLDGKGVIPRILSQCNMENDSEMRLLVRYVGVGMDMVDLGVYVKMLSKPISLNVALNIMKMTAKCLGELHAIPNSTAIIDVRARNFFVMSKNPVVVVASNLNRCISIKMLRDRPDLCSNEYHDIFNHDTRELAKMFLDLFTSQIKANKDLGVLIKNMSSVKEYTMARVFTKLELILSRQAHE